MRWLFRLVGVFLTLIILALAGLFLIPTEKIAVLAAQQFQTATGRSLVLSGKVRPSFYPQVGVTTGPVEIGNADWSTEGPMLKAEGLAIGLDFAALLQGDIVIRKVEALQPVIVLEIGADGRGNWEIGAAGAPAATGDASATGGGLQKFTLDQGLISGGALTFIDHATGSRTDLRGIDADIKIPVFDGPADIALSAEMNGQRVAVTARLADFAASLSGVVSPLEAEVETGGAGGSFAGRIGISPIAAEGRLDAGVSDLAALFALIGQPAPALPAGLGKTIGLAGQVTYTAEGSAHLRGGTITVGANTLTGDADLYPGEDRPRLVAQLAAGGLDLSALLSSGSGSGGSAASGWPQDAIDVSGLNALDAEVALTAGSVNLGSSGLGATDIALKLDAGRAVVSLRDVRAYDGRVTGEFVLNGRKGLSVGGNLVVADMAMNPVLRDFAGYDRLIGAADLQFKFLGVGNSVAAIMSSLSGQGSLALGRGELKGFDLVGMLRTLDTSYVGAGASTIFDSVTASFSIDGGVLSNADLVFLAPLLRADGEGKIGLGARTLNYRVTPSAMTEADGSGGIKVPLLITGPWSSPNFALDLEALAGVKLEEELEKLEAAAKEKLTAEAAKLGLEVKDGESVEDAAKRTLEEKAAAELGKLLGTGVAAPAAPAPAAPAPEKPAGKPTGKAAKPAAPKPAEKPPEEQLLDLLLKKGLGG